MNNLQIYKNLDIKTYGEPSIILEVNTSRVMVDSVFLKKCVKSHRMSIARVMKR